MFTGIVESMGLLASMVEEGTNVVLDFKSPLSDELKVDQSLAHNGVCLTVVCCGSGQHRVVAVKETMKRTALGDLKVGDAVNLERCLRLGDRLDGHWVQGHVDDTGLCTSIQDEGGSWLFTFQYPARHAALLVPKGSITVNGVSLTLVDLGLDFFMVAVIPYTFQHTTLGQLQVGHRVNLEFDLLGKYFLRQQSLLNTVPATS
ncbi:MAG: riboflavin synthase [Sphingomonadales bacterium]|nr:riboflavin synthase [Sphingomonadales bacterium]MBM3923254.1 riboflavin synthase [Sphingomonadales bacterium]MBM3931631.1 riboflavin synthase [Sphingomonadales bacterium]